MAKLYPKDYHIGRDDEAHRKRYERQFSYLSTLRPERILDIGCARGDWLNFLHEKWPHSELHGVDAFSSRVHGDAVKFQQCALTDAVLSPDSFDLITAWAVFEHLHTPREYFETVARVLRPGGKFVFLVTNSESCYGKYANSEDVPRHLYHFSEKILSKYADHCRLRLESAHYDDALWDGRGHGTFRYLSGRLAGVRWDNYYFKRFNLLQRAALLMGRTLDRFVFSSHWEARLRRSGIMVAIMSKDT
jgi:SAM-dependent methyltransferase